MGEEIASRGEGEGKLGLVEGLEMGKGKEEEGQLSVRCGGEGRGDPKVAGFCGTREI